MTHENSNLPEKLIERINDVPPLPAIVVEVMRMTRNPSTTAKQLTDVISKDQGLTGNVLRLCNSAYYGLPRTVSSLNQAVMYLGFHTVRNLVITCSIHNFFNPKARIYGYDKGGLWIHVIACARVCDMICEKIRPDLRDTAYTAGLLHDLGQLIIGNQIEDTADSIIEVMVNDNLTDIQAEEAIVGYSHNVLGAVVAEKWNFPTELVHAIRYHHQPDEVEENVILTDIVHVADTIVLDIGFGVNIEQMKYPTSKNALNVLGMDTEFLAFIRNRADNVITAEIELLAGLGD
jgi:putative nucleotidyltransferase with HDIG domain